ADGIRDFHVTGVQTCALPIYAVNTSLYARLRHPWLCTILESYPPSTATFSVFRLVQLTLHTSRQLSPAGAGQLDVVDHHGRRAGYAHLHANLQALLNGFFVE